MKQILTALAVVFVMLGGVAMAASDCCNLPCCQPGAECCDE